MALTVENVRLTRGDFAFSADFSVSKPGLTAIIGPSGGGKSTFLALIAGFILPDTGRVLWNNADLAPLAPGARPVAMLFQDNNLFPHLDIVTNVALGAAPIARPDAETRARASNALARVGLVGFETRKPADLSGGQQSRAALARVLLTDRPVVLMDEPFSALGPAQRREMLDLVRKLLPDATILMVTHDPLDAQQAQQTILIANGHAAAPQLTETLFADPPPELESYLR